MVRFPLPSWGLSVVQQGPHGGVSVWLASVVVPVAVVEDGGLEVFGAVVFFDAEHEGHHIVIDVEEADIKCLGGHHWLLWWLCEWWVARGSVLLVFVVLLVVLVVSVSRNGSL